MGFPWVWCINRYGVVFLRKREKKKSIRSSQLRRKKVIAGYKALMQRRKQWMKNPILSLLLIEKLIFLSCSHFHVLTIWIFLFAQFRIVSYKVRMLR
ncbi:MAG: hypothetical protein AUG75_18770 [Cyanobacteria bacterium 13_1_20CM_4_61_6]|nr:MAG: hypothetical protein AUG75_18770 [Cyanobacteria bacterium 13_1_20CM_4_61_6]